MNEQINLAEATLAKELKSHILSKYIPLLCPKTRQYLILTTKQADIYALYTPIYPSLPVSSYDIITSGRTSYPNNTCYGGITAYAILYTKPNQWKLLVAGNKADSVGAALTSLWKEVQAKVMIVMAPTKMGDIYKGSRAG